MNVIVVIPTYNEKGNIEKLIPVIFEKVFPMVKNYKMHILVADDNSPDGTAKSVSTLMRKYKNLHLISGKKEGLGKAYIRAMDYSIKRLNADIMIVMDADFFHDPKKIPLFLKKIEKGFDIVVGTRYSNGGSIPKAWGTHRKILSILGNSIIRAITMKFYIHDWTGGFRAIKKEVFLKEKTRLKNFSGYTFNVAFLYKAILDGFKVEEVPFKASERIMGYSKISPFEYSFSLLKYVLTERFLELTSKKG